MPLFTRHRFAPSPVSSAPSSSASSVASSGARGRTPGPQGSPRPPSGDAAANVQAARGWPAWAHRDRRAQTDTDAPSAGATSRSSTPAPRPPPPTQVADGAATRAGAAPTAPRTHSFWRRREDTPRPPSPANVADAANEVAHRRFWRRSSGEPQPNTPPPGARPLAQARATPTEPADAPRRPRFWHHGGPASQPQSPAASVDPQAGGGWRGYVSLGPQAQVDGTPRAEGAASPHRSWRSYATFGRHEDAANRGAQQQLATRGGDAAAAGAGATPPQVTSYVAAIGAVHAQTPSWAGRPAAAVDTARRRVEGAWQARLEGLLERGTDLERPRPLVHRYVAERSAARAAARGVALPLRARDAIVETRARRAANLLDRRLGQAAAYTFVGPLSLLGPAAGPGRSLRVGNAVAAALGVPAHGTLAIVSAALGIVAAGCGGLGAALGFGIGYLLAGVVLALVPNSLLHAWLRGHSLEVSTHRRAEAAYAWLHDHFGTAAAPATPQARLHALAERPDAAAPPRLPLPAASYAELERGSRAHRDAVARCAAELEAAPEDLDARVEALQRETAAAQHALPPGARALLGVQQEPGLLDAHRELMGALREGARQQRIDRLLRGRQERVAAALALPPSFSPALDVACVDSVVTER